MDELLKWRGEFPILDRSTYLISNSLGAMPRGVYDGMRAYADSWAERGVRAWEEGWWEMAVGVGAHVILDVFQATGTIPINVRALGADFAVGGVLKWLCGGPGVGYLYVREDLRAKLRPALTGWIAHRRPFDFETGAIDAREDSFRFLNGTPHIPALYAGQPSLDILNSVGIEPIRAKSVRMTARLFEGAKAHGWRVNTPENPADRAGTVSIDCPHAYEVCRELLAREILVDFRPKAGVRFSPHFYNRLEECDFALEQVDEILRTHAWEKHAAASAPA